jgi:hypothetical protein
MQAPFLDRTWQTWVLGNRAHKYPRFDRVFEIHEDRSEHDAAYDARLLALGVPLFVGASFPDGPNAVRYDYEATRPFFFGRLYLTSSPAYMLAQAILEGAEEIALYGCDMAVDDAEYFWQRPCVEAWVGVAIGRGIKVTIPDASPVGKSRIVEGLDHGKGRSAGPFAEAEFRRVARMHAEKKAALEAQMEALQRSMAAHDGALQSYERMAQAARAWEAGIPLQTLSETVRIK